MRTDKQFKRALENVKRIEEAAIGGYEVPSPRKPKIVISRRDEQALYKAIEVMKRASNTMRPILNRIESENPDVKTKFDAYDYLFMSFGSMREGLFDVEKSLNTLRASIVEFPIGEAGAEQGSTLAEVETDPADEAYDLITKWQNLERFVLKGATDLINAFKKAASDVEGAKRYGGQHLAALDLLGGRPLDAAKSFEELGQSVVSSIEKVVSRGKVGRGSMGRVRD